MLKRVFAIALLCSAPAVARAEEETGDEDKKPRPSPEQIDREVRTAINRSASQIDACNARHVSEYPKAKGKADVTVTVAKEGTVKDAVVQTSLEGARNLRYCLERVAKAWRFPSHGAAPQELSITVAVAQGTKFKIPMPGEKRPEEKKAERQEGFIRFLPAKWVPDSSGSAQ